MLPQLTGRTPCSNEASNWGLKPAVLPLKGSAGKSREMNHWNSCVDWTYFGSWPLFASKSSSRNQPILNITHTFGSTSGEFFKSQFKDSSWVSLLTRTPYITERYYWFAVFMSTFLSATFAVLAIKKMMPRSKTHILFCPIFICSYPLTKPKIWWLWCDEHEPLYDSGADKTVNLKPGLFQKILDVKSPHFRLLWNLVKQKKSHYKILK